MAQGRQQGVLVMVNICGNGADHTVVGFYYEENQYKPERVIVTPVSENSYMWLAQ